MMKKISKAEAAVLVSSFAKLSFFFPCEEIEMRFKRFVLNDTSVEVELRFHYTNDAVLVYWYGVKDYVRQVLNLSEVLELIDNKDLKIQMLYHIDLLDV